MSEYKKRYEALNTAQKQAVDQIDGPVIVIAGPGTGKTELLSMRAANILRCTDMNPGNILCLTYTESGVRAMRERLIELIGQDAYKIAIQTFHGFGSEVISNNPDYFYSGADFRPADELSTYEILYGIFRNLPHNNPLSSKMGNEYSYMKKVQTSISDFKRAGLTPDELQRIAHHSLQFIDFAEPKIQSFWPQKVDKKIIAEIQQLIDSLSKYHSDTVNVPNIIELDKICLQSLREAAETAAETGKTNTITAWKDQWLEKSREGVFVFKNRKRLDQLNASSLVYQEYLNAMQDARLYDYDDMILRTSVALEIAHDLRLNLQEKYQYIMVDEFQDTNGAQMRILTSLMSLPTGDAPNIMVVGDDDQAVYSFQGADISNILGFEKLLENPQIITLKQNYRSVGTILESSRSVITQGTNRLEDQLKEVDKSLIAHQKAAGKSVDLTVYESQAAEFLQVAESIKKTIKAGQKPSEIAVLARSKKDILAFLPYLHHHDVKVSYEHDENVLESASVDILVLLSQLVVDINNGAIDGVNEILPEVLSHPAFSISVETLWQLSLDAYKNRQSWLEVMLEQKGDLKIIAGWLLEIAKLSPHIPVESMIDILFGTQTNESYTSPLKQYFFSDKNLVEKPGDYIVHLQSLATIRTNIREYKPQSQLYISDFVDYITLAKNAGITLKNHYSAEVIDDAIQVMTAHKSKGLEFESVYILNASDDTWGSKSRGPSGRLSYPENVPIGIAGDSYDDKLRLFFVAMTRAKKGLHISTSNQNLAGKPLLKADFLSELNWDVSKIDATPLAKVQSAEYTWQSHVDLNDDHTLRELLVGRLKNYRLSATHLNNFLDVTSGGPMNFLLNNLLHFPQSLSASAAMGSSVHKALQKAHQHLRVTGEKRPVEDVVGDFENYLKSMRLPGDDLNHQLQKGSDALRIYLDNSYQKFTAEQEVEFDFSKQGSSLEDVRLTGIIDVMSVDIKKKTIDVIDYKTGKPTAEWKGTTDFEKIKLHKYKQQLMFYRLLIENSRDFSDYKVDDLCLEFVEPTKAGTSASLQAQYSEQEFEDFKKLVRAVWRKIIDCDFVDISNYTQNYKGVLEFEKDLKS
ncbi:MAG: ATP-dependent DNA helicase [Candidatus Saccharibacteria bacterium]|nr:ATP-dependent DNA helicase [Candidatus Saccharibacteria bacterium]